MAAARPIRVLLTGGPGGGKTSALATLRDRLTRRGFQALVVPETASAILGNAGGYDPAWIGTARHVDLQEIFMKYQMFQEETYINIAALRPQKPAVVICDRGLIEGKLFCSDEEWAESLRRLGTTEDELLKRYDVVIHMTSTASGMPHLYDYGPGSSNPSRYHTPAQARETDLKAQDLYARHPQVRIVSNFSDFTMKIETVLGHVFEILKCGASGTIGEWDRVLVSADVPAEGNWPVKYDVYEQLVTFLDATFAESVRRRELVLFAAEGAEPTKPDPDVGQVHFEHRKEVKQGDRTCSTRQVLSSEAYHLLRERFDKDSMAEVKKRSVCFVWEDNHYELSSYMSADGNALGEDWELRGARVLDKPVSAPVPKFLQCADACDPDFASQVVNNVPNLNVSSPALTSQTTQTPTRKLARHATIDAATSASKAWPPVPGMTPFDDSAPPSKRPRVSGIASAVKVAEHASDRRSPSPPLRERRGEAMGRSPQLSKVAAAVVLQASPLRQRAAKLEASQ